MTQIPSDPGFNAWKIEFDREREVYRSANEVRITSIEIKLALAQMQVTNVEKKQADYVTKADYAPVRYTFVVTGAALLTAAVGYLLKLLPSFIKLSP